MKRCISVKKDIIQFGEAHFTGFHSIYPDKIYGTKGYYIILPQGDNVACFPFAKLGEEETVQHMQVEKGFWREKICIRLNQFYLSYFVYDWNLFMATGKVLRFLGYGKLARIPPAYTICSPWFEAENDRESLQRCLEELGQWYEAHLPEIQLSYQKQQVWLSKEYRAVKVAKGYLSSRLPTLTEDEVRDMYQTVDGLAEEFNALDILPGSKPTSSFGYFCYGKLPDKFNQWADEISTTMLSKRGRITDDIEYTHLFAVTALLYLFHDSQEQRCPGTLKRILHPELAAKYP